MTFVDMWRSAIVDKGIIVLGRAEWMHIQREEVQCGLLNLYAPNLESVRMEFWTQIADARHDADEWFVGGDTNMIEALENRRGGMTAQSLYVFEDSRYLASSWFC